MPGYYFFFSYARADRNSDNQDVIGRFFRDVTEQVRLAKGLAPREISFFDAQDLEPGEVWPDQLREALRTSRAFVPMLSSTYFSREYCGREWAVFDARLTQHAEQTGDAIPPLIQPVLLVRRAQLTPLPQAIADRVGDLQTTYAKYPHVYGEEGLSYMVRLSEHADDYMKFVIRFAERLMEVVGAHELVPPGSIPPIKQVESAFHEPGTHVAVNSSAPPPVGRSAQFLFVSGRRDELTRVREDVAAYGPEGGLDWQPYRPDVTDEVAIIAQDVASSEKLRYEAVPVDDRLGDRLDEAARTRKIVVLVADMWTLRLDGYHKLMKELDARSLPNAVVLVPWNERDSETATSGDTLENALYYTFENRVVTRDAGGFLDRISSAKQFREELSKSLNKARLRLLSMEEVRRKVESEQVIVKPEIRTPGSPSL
jgi:FxsC-like protein